MAFKFLMKLNITLSYDPAIVLLGSSPNKNKNISKNDLYEKAHRSFIDNNSELKRAQMLVKKNGYCMHTKAY